MYEQEKLVATRFFDEVWNQGKLEVLPELTSECIIHDPLLGEIQGRQGEEMFITGFRTGFPDLKFTVHTMVAEAPYVSVRWTVEGTHTGPMLGIQPTGQHDTMTGMSLLRFENGKIVETWIARDDLKMFQRLGLAQALPAPAAV